MASYEKNVILTSTSASGDKYTIFPKTKMECVEGLKEALSGGTQSSANIINDETPSGSTTYSATKINALFDEQETVIDDKVGTDELNTAVNNALTEAKNSGEFKGDKGDPGNDGKTPEKGTDYWTEEDKTEIVSDVLASLPNASGVSF